MFLKSTLFFYFFSISYGCKVINEEPTTTPECACENVTVCPETFTTSVSDKDRCIRVIFENFITWEEGKKLCEDAGGSMGGIITPEELEQIGDIVISEVNMTNIYAAPIWVNGKMKVNCTRLNVKDSEAECGTVNGIEWLDNSSNYTNFFKNYEVIYGVPKNGCLRMLSSPALNFFEIIDCENTSEDGGEYSQFGVLCTAKN